MLGQLELRNEWRFLARNPLLWIALVAMAGFSLLLANGSTAEPGTDTIAALLRLNLFIPIFMLPFLAGALGPAFYLREVDHNMAEMFGTYPVTLRQWLCMRVGNFFLVLIGASLLAQCIFVAMLAGDQSSLSPHIAGYSLLWLMVLHLPSCILWASLLAALASRKPNAGFLYMAAGLIWLGYLAIAGLTGTPLISGSVVVWPLLREVMLVLDPYAATALVNPMPEQGLLQWREVNVALGRIIWLLVCFQLLRCVKDLPAHSERKLSTLSNEKAQPPTGTGSTPSWESKRWLGHIGVHLLYIARDKVFPLLILGWLALLIPEVFSSIDYAEPLSRIVPDSRDALNRVVWDIIPLAGALTTLYAADRICRMYSATRMHELFAATSYRPERLAMVQLTCLWIVAAFFLSLSGLSVFVVQLISQSAVQPSEYVLQLGLSMLDLALFCALLVAMHGLIRPRFLANLAGLLVLVLGSSNLAPALGLEHPLWRVLDTPRAMPDHYWGFVGSISGHITYSMFWFAICIAALLLAMAKHHRTLPHAQVRFKTALHHPATTLAAVCIFAAAWQGTAITRTLSNEGALTSSNERAKQRADYERGYAHWNALAQPEVERIQSHVDFYTQENRVRLRSVMHLVNRSKLPIDQVLVGENELGTGGKVRLRGATIAKHDPALGQTVFKLSRPLKPGDGLELGFETMLTQPSLDTAEMPFVLRPTFSMLPAYSVLPVIGFRREFTLRDPVMRQQQGLPRIRLIAPSQLPIPANGSITGNMAILDAVVSTEAGHQAIAQGALIRRWKTRERSYFHYSSNGPSRNLPVFLTIPWQPQTWTAGRNIVETYSPKLLDANDANIAAMRDTLAWLGSDVSAYPETALRLVAVPEIGPSGYALPQVILISHRLGFRATQKHEAGFSQIYRRAAHETAHQWFGHLLGHGIVEERAFMVESLAKYAELVMIEQRYGKPAMQALVEFERDRYRQARLDPTRSITPLIDAEESEDMYSRATLTFACLRQLAGDKPIVEALKRLAADTESNRSPRRSIDFVNELKQSSRPELSRPIKALFLGDRPLFDTLADLGCSARG
jgi:ABC-2 type transport system permease protein